MNDLYTNSLDIKLAIITHGCSLLIDFTLCGFQPMRMHINVHPEDPYHCYHNVSLVKNQKLFIGMPSLPTSKRPAVVDMLGFLETSWAAKCYGSLNSKSLFPSWAAFASFTKTEYFKERIKLSPRNGRSCFATSH